MTEPQKGGAQRTPPSDTPSFVKRALIWLSAGASLLAAAVVFVDNGQKLTESLSGFWTSLFGQASEPVRPKQPAEPPKSTTTQRPTPPPSSNPLLGRWVSLNTGDTLEFRSNGDVWDARFGQARFSVSDVGGANLAIRYRQMDCFYYVSFIDKNNKMAFDLREGAQSCPTGIFGKTLD
jgi:hypothetical protein